MDHHSRAELIRAYRKRYTHASKTDKAKMIDTIVDATGYARKHAIRALNQAVVVPEKVRRPRVSRYLPIVGPLRTAWAASNFLCGKRLAPFLPVLVLSLKRHGEIKLTQEQEAMLSSISAATIDRLLAPCRKDLNPKGRSTTKPGTLLKHQIPIRTFADWDDHRPGFLEIDLVAHCGDATRGEYINTLDMTDVATGWTICTAFMGRSERFCVAAIGEARPHFPFPILGIDSDNGSEFINAHLKRYCERNSITFTRGRSNKKNDSCYIEQKNWDVVRKMLGYGRFDTYEQLEIITRVYNLLSLYQNYFQPSRKLLKKVRTGARVRKTYDEAQTPAQRLIARKDTPSDTSTNLKVKFSDLNPAQILRAINDLVLELYHP